MTLVSTLAIKQDIKRIIKNIIGFDNLLIIMLFILLIVFSFVDNIKVNLSLLIGVGAVFTVLSTFIAIKLNKKIKQEVEEGQRLIFKNRWKGFFKSNFYYILFLVNLFLRENNEPLILTIVFCILWLIVLNLMFKPAIDLKIVGEQLLFDTSGGKKLLDFSTPIQLELKDGSLYSGNNKELMIRHLQLEDEEILKINDFLAINYGEKELLKVV